MTMKLLDLYKAILASADLSVSKDGCVSVGSGDDAEPLTIKGKRLVLPTREHMANPDRTNRVLFHPLSEILTRGESEVLARYRAALNYRLNHVIGALMFGLLQIGTSVDGHKHLSPDQSEFLSMVKDADEKTLENLRLIMKAVPDEESDRLFVSIFVKKGGVLEGKTHFRSAIVSFPFYQLLLENPKKIHGVTVRGIDRDAYRGLLEYILPNIAQPHSYSRGSDSKIAPSIDALMSALRGLAGMLNAQIELFDYKFGKDLLIPGDWEEAFENIAVMRDQISEVPMQPGNEGSSLKTEAVRTEAPSTLPAPVQQPTAPAAPAFVTPQQPQQPQQPQDWTKMVEPIGTKPPSTHAPVMEQHPSGGGTDFDAFLRSHPSMAQSVGFGQPGFNQPAWAQPQGWQQPQQPPRATMSSPYGAGFSSYSGWPPGGQQQGMWQQPPQQQQQWGQPQQQQWGQPATPYGTL